eukprot:7026977-Prymnesium_polylepis.1
MSDSGVLVAKFGPIARGLPNYPDLHCAPTSTPALAAPTALYHAGLTTLGSHTPPCRPRAPAPAAQHQVLPEDGHELSCHDRGGVSQKEVHAGAGVRAVACGRWRVGDGVRAVVWRRWRAHLGSEGDRRAKGVGAATGRVLQQQAASTRA